MIPQTMPVMCQITSHEYWHVLAVMFGHPSQISIMWNTQLTTWHLFVHVCLPAALSSHMERDLWGHERQPLAFIASLSARVVYTNPLYLSVSLCTV